MPSFFGLRFSTHDEDERAQKNTFTRWINLHLEEHSSSGRVVDLFEDMKDGVLLCHLIEVLTGEALPVCRTRASKRVHHISNLTNALTVLRRRGLELVNNNASDIADGNPRIVLGLIWQIILHFQIESNMALLREWGWGSTSMQQPPQQQQLQYSRESSPLQAAPSPTKKSRLVAFLSPGPSTSSSSTDSPKMSVKHVKSSVEQVMLRWINAEIAQKLNIRVENMDRDWKDGVMFNALVHRWRPDVVDMDKVRTAEPRENLENAFELAHKHLGIYKLLEVDDVLGAKPDKRSIITYVSQFIRTYGKSPPVEDNTAHKDFLEWLAFTYRLDLKNNEQGMYFRVRREFIEYRSLYNTIMATKLNYTIEELAEIQERWEIIRNNLEATAISAEKRLPKPYSSLSLWTATGQSLINTPLNLPTDDPNKCLSILQKMISDHNRHFIDMNSKMEELEKAVESGGLGGRPVAAEYVEPLRVRMQTLAAEAPLKLATLKILHAHYTLFAYLHNIDTKMQLWSSAESLQLLNRWITEYTHLEQEDPHSNCNHYINDLKKELTSQPETKLDGDSMLRTCRGRSDQVLKEFDSMKTTLWTLRRLWTEWEMELKRLDDMAMIGIDRRTNTLQEESEAIRVLESKFDELSPLLSASARLACNQRMELLRVKVKQLNKFGASCRLVVELVPSSSSSPLQQQSSSTSQSKVIKVTNLSEATASIQEMEAKLAQRPSRGADGELQETYEKMEVKRRLNALRRAKPQMNAVEVYLAQLDEWLASPDAYDRAKAFDILDQIGKAIDAIETEDTGRYVDCQGYRTALQEFTGRLHGEGTSYTPQQAYEQPPVDKDFVREVIARAELILNRRESNEDELRASQNDMADCEAVLLGWNSKRLSAMRQRWETKRLEFELWQTQMDRVQQIAAQLEHDRAALDPSTLAELQRIEASCDRMTTTDLALPLRLAIRDLRLQVESSFEERLECLRMSGEEDCAVAHHIVEEVGEELVAFCPQLNERHTEARRVLNVKMELFRRLQNYYDAVKYLRNRNIAWNTITVGEVPSVSEELQSLLKRCDTELHDDALRLRTELNAISGSFFELEFDRVNEKLNLLIYEKDKLRDLMRIRVEYLDAVHDFIESADSSTVTTRMATPSDSAVTLEDRTMELCKELEVKAERLRRMQAPAEMTVTNLTPAQLIRQFRWELIGPSEYDTVTFGEAARHLEEFLSRDLPSTDDVKLFLPTAAELKRMEEAEHKAFDEMTELAVSVDDRNERDRLTALYKERQDQRKQNTLNYLYAYDDYLNLLFRSYEEKVVQLTNNRALNDLQKFNDGEWRQWKEDVGELENVLEPSMRLRFRPELADLQRKAFSLDGKIGRSIASSAKQRRHEEKLAAKLAQFETWLQAIDEDTDAVERMPPGDEQTARLTQLLISCLGQQRLVGKLERLNVQNRDHVQQLCQTYYTILTRLRRHNLDEGALPLHVSTLVQGAPTQSQLSISSLTSSDFGDRPESVQSVCSSIDVSSASADIETPLEKAIGDIRKNLHRLIHSYNNGTKPLATAIADYNLLLQYRGELNRLFGELPPGTDTKKEALENSLHHLLEHLSETATKLQEEIDEEVSLSAKEKEIVQELTKLEERVRSRDVSDVNVVYDLDQLQTQMDLLRMISSRPRQFVESDMMVERGGDAAQSRRRPKRKVLVMVTNTVTTIIQVVEERLLTIEMRSRDPVVQQKLDLVKTNLKKLEEEAAAGSPPESMVDIPTAEESHTLYTETDKPAKATPGDEAAFATAVHAVEQALNIAEGTDLESCRDPHVLAESLNILERQQASMDALRDTASDLAKAGNARYLDKISTVQERLLSVKYTLVERLTRLRAQTPSEVPSTSTSDFNKFADEVRTATTAAEKVLDDSSADADLLQKTKESLESHEPSLVRLSELASTMAQSGDTHGIDVASCLAEQFNGVRYAIGDRIDQLTVERPTDTITTPIEETASTSAREFNKLADEVSAATESAEKVFDDSSADADQLQKAKEKLESHEPTLSKLSDLATAMARSGDADGIDAVSSLTEQFEGVRYAIADRIDEIRHERPADTITIPIEETPSTSAAEFNRLADKVRAATCSAEKVLDDNSADAEQLQKAKEKLESHETTLAKLSDMATAMAQSGDADGIDAVSSLTERFEGVRYAIADRIDEIRHERSTDTVTIPIEETPSTSAAEFNKLADEVRAATDSAEKVLEDYTAEADQLQKTKEKLESHEPTLSKLSDMATAMAQSGDADGIDVVSSLAQQFEGVRCAIEDRIDDIAHEQPAEEEAPTTSDAEFNRLVDEVRAATDAAENVLFEGTSDVDRLQKTREALESHEPAWTKLTDLAMVRVHSGDTDGSDVVSSLSEQYEAVRFAIVDRIDELRSEASKEVPTTSFGDFDKLAKEVRDATTTAEEILADGAVDAQQLQKAKEGLESHEPALSELRDIAEAMAHTGNPDGIDVVSSLVEQFEGVRYGLADRIDELTPETAEGLISSTVTCPTADVSGTSSDDFYKLVDEVRAATASAEKVLEDRTTASPLLLRAREQLKRQEPVLSKLSEIASVKAQTGDPYGVDVVSSLAKEFSGVQYAIDDRVNKLVSEKRRTDLEDEIARRAADEALEDAITPVSTRLVQLVNEADRLLGDAEGVPAQYRPSAEELTKECKKAVEILRDAPKAHPSVESLETALSAAENMIPVLEERANNWDEFVRVRDEADVELDKLRQPLDEVLAKPRRPISEAKHDFDVISVERQKSDILAGKVRRLQELSEMLDPLESAYADVRFIDVDAEQTEKQYDDVLNELSNEIEDESLLCDSVDHFITEMNAICESLAAHPAKETIENIEQFQIPALQAQLAMLHDKHDEANHARKHVDPDSSRLSNLDDRMNSLEALLRDAQSATEKDEQERLIVVLGKQLSELESVPLRELPINTLDDVENQIHILPSEKVEQLQKQVDDLRKTKKQHDDNVRDTLERLAAVDDAIATLPTTRDIPALEANLGRLRDARDSLADLPTDVLTDENIAKKVEDTKKVIDDLSKSDEEDLQKLLADRDARNNAVEALEQLRRDVEDMENMLPIALPSSSELSDFKQAKTPRLLTKLDAIRDIPVDLLPTKEDLSNRIDIISKKLDDQVDEMKNFEQKTAELQNVVDDCRGKLKPRDAPAPIGDVAKDEQDLSEILYIIESIPQEDLAPRNQLARDVNNIREEVKGELATLRKALSDEEKAREKEDEVKNRLLAIADGLNKIDPDNAETAKQVATIEVELQKLAGVADACRDFATSPSPIVSHDDLDKSLPEQLQKLQKECDEKKRDVEQAAQLKAVAPEILLISESLQQQPEEIPQNLNEQQSVLEDLETKKQRLENLIQTIPDGDATEELRQKSQWDLSRLKDLLKRLGDSVGDKLAALAAFNAARKDAEDQLLIITSPVSEEKAPEDLKKDEDSLQRLQQNIAQLDSADLDEAQRDEHTQLLDRINKALDLTKKRRTDLEDEIARRAADEALEDAITPVSTRLVQLVNETDRLLGDAEGVPTQYRPSAAELMNECKKAIEIVSDAPEAHPSVDSLKKAIASAQAMIPRLEERAKNWDLFVGEGEDATRKMESINLYLSRIVPRAVLLSPSEGEDLLRNLKNMYGDIERLRASDKYLSELAILLWPLLVVQQEIRFFTVDQENTEKHYEETTETLAAELAAEAQLNRTLEILTAELNQCAEELLSNDGRKDRLSHESLLQDIIAHLENQKVVVERSAQCRQFIESSTSSSLDLLTERAQELLETLRHAPQTSDGQHERAAMEEYDVDAAAEVLAALYPETHPYSVLAEHGFEGIAASDTDSKSELESIDGSSSGMLSPLPETSTGLVPTTHFHRQRSRWRRVLRTALPLQAMLVLLLGAACLVPHCDDEYCCQLLNNFARSFDPSLEFINGPPPF